MDIGSRIKISRQKQKISREELSSRLGISKFAIAKYEQGQRTPSIDMLLKIASALNLTPHYFLEKRCIDSARLLNSLSEKKLTPELLVKDLNLDELILVEFMNNCEIIYDYQVKALHKISDYLSVSDTYLLGESDFKLSEDYFINNLESIFTKVKLQSNENISDLFNEILDSITLTLYNPINGGNLEALSIIKKYYDLLVVINQAFNNYTSTTPGGNVHYYDGAQWIDSDIDKFISDSKDKFSSILDELLKYHSNLCK